MADNNPKGIIDKADGVLVEVYKDALSPMVRPFGEILGFLPRTLRLTLCGWEKWLINGEETIRLTAESIKEKLKVIPEDKLVAPEPYVAIPAMQQLSYSANNEDLRELYANLLVSSMNADKKWQVHPSFVDILKQLTPDEAKLLKVFQPTTLNCYPIIDVRLENKHGSGHVLYSNFTTIGINNLDMPNYIGLYIDNLFRLKIIEIPAMTIHSDREIYNELEQHPIVQRSLPRIHTDLLKIKYKHKVFNVTTFGVSFINTIV